MAIVTKEVDTGLAYQIEGTNIVVHMPAADQLVLGDSAARHFISAMEELDTFLTARTGIVADHHLSDLGRSHKLAPLTERLIDRTASIWSGLRSEEIKVDALEAQLLEVPKLDAGYTAMAIEDAEVRGYWRGLPSAERLKILDQMNKDPARHERIALALLRSPIELIDREARMVREIWNARQRAKDPDLAASIEVRRKAIEFGRRGTAQAASHALMQSRWDARTVLRRLVGHAEDMARNGYGAFGFAEAQARRELMLMQQQKLAKA